MIRRHGHYILELRSKLDPNNDAYCLKCGESFCTANGRASTAWVFDKPCRGTWKKELASIDRAFDQAEKRRAIALKWIAFDCERRIRRSMRDRLAEARQKGGFGVGGLQVPFSPGNAANRL